MKRPSHILFCFFFLLFSSHIFAQKRDRFISLGLSFNSEYTYNNDAANNSNPAIGLSALFQWAGLATESSIYFAEREFTDWKFYVLGNPRFPVPIPLSFEQIFLEKSFTLEQTIKYQNFRNSYFKNYLGFGFFTKLAQQVELARTTSTGIVGLNSFEVYQLDIDEDAVVPGFGIVFFTEIESTPIYNLTFGAQLGVRVFVDQPSVNASINYHLQETILKGRNANHAFLKFKIAYVFD